MGLTEAIRKISYPKLPRLLIIQLKRFSGGMEKINSYIPTPFTLQCFCAACISDYDNTKCHEYKLYSVITHVGSTLQAGHYIAYTCALNQNNADFDCFKNIQAMTSAINATTINSHATNSSMSVGATVEEINETGSGSGLPMKSTHSNELNRQSSFSSNSTSKKASVVQLISKITLGRKKSSAQSADGNGKNNKIVNGLKVPLNGIDSKLTNHSANLTQVAKIHCLSSTCCGIKMKTNLLTTNATASTNTTNLSSNGNDAPMTNGMEYDSTRSKLNSFNTNIDHLSSGGYLTRSLDDDGAKKLADDDEKMALRRQRHQNNGATNSSGSSNSNCDNGSGSGNGNGNGTNSGSNSNSGAFKMNSEPIWYMCDDDKIRAIPQHEFREMLLPKKNMITPYLLFYARNDVFEPH